MIRKVYERIYIEREIRYNGMKIVSYKPNLLSIVDPSCIGLHTTW